MSVPKGFFFKIRVNDEEHRIRLYATTSDWSPNIRLSDDEKSILLIGDQQVRFTDSHQDKYIFHSLLNTNISYTLDLSHVPRHWNAAVYTTDLSHEKVPFYRDAQSFPPRIEIDIQEANKHAFRYTAHKSGDRNGHLIMGLGGTIQFVPSQQFKSSQTHLPPEELYGVNKYINTNIPFRVSVTHTHTSVRLELSQEERIIYHETSEPLYLSQCRLAEPIHVFILSLWTGNMWWLDEHLPLYEEDDRLHTQQVILSDFSIQHIAPTPHRKQKTLSSWFMSFFR
jgi:hypothetical protein